jgi:hypothetical protein
MIKVRMSNRRDFDEADMSTEYTIMWTTWTGNDQCLVVFPSL